VPIKYPAIGLKPTSCQELFNETDLFTVDSIAVGSLAGSMQLVTLPAMPAVSLILQ
jgi:hypothetical protein